MNGTLDHTGTCRYAEYVCQHCQTDFEVWDNSSTAGHCPICGKDPGAPEVIG